MATTIKDALSKWQNDNKDEPITQALNVGLQFQWPPIEKMDNNLAVLTKCEKLSLSTNMIEKINGLSALKNLKILSLGRNKIKTFIGLEPLSETLEELWISYNIIEKMKGVLGMRKLKVLHMSNNNVKDWEEVQKLTEMESLQDLVFMGNPLAESMEESIWRNECIRRLPKLAILDAVPIIRISKE